MPQNYVGLDVNQKSAMLSFKKTFQLYIEFQQLRGCQKRYYHIKISMDARTTAGAKTTLIAYTICDQNREKSTRRNTLKSTFSIGIINADEKRDIVLKETLRLRTEIDDIQSRNGVITINDIKYRVEFLLVADMASLWELCNMRSHRSYFCLWCQCFASIPKQYKKPKEELQKILNTDKTIKKLPRFQQIQVQTLKSVNIYRKSL